MMRKFRAEVASTNIDSDGDQLTKEQLNSILNLPAAFTIILDDFNPKRGPLGKVISSKISGNKAIVEGEIKDGLQKGYIVIGGMINRNLGKVVINKFAFTKKPVDKSLKPIEYID